MTRGRRRSSGAIVAAGLLLSLAGCGDAPATQADPSVELRQRAVAAGLDVDLVYVTDVHGYQAAAGGSGAYGDAGYQAIYASSRGDDLRLTVERRSLDAGTCAALPVPGAEPVDATVQCTRDGDGWRRVAGDRQEYAVAHDGRLIRVSGQIAATTPQLIRSAVLDARPATSSELNALLPPLTRETVQRGDIHGDDAPDNHVGAGG